jgi:hypothetical protein
MFSTLNVLEGIAGEGKTIPNVLHILVNVDGISFVEKFKIFFLTIRENSIALNGSCNN